MGEELASDKVWIPDKKTVWRTADVIGFDEGSNKLEVARNDHGKYETLKINADLTLSYDKDHEEDFPNAFNMGDLNEAALLGLLERRSFKDLIYTFTGDVLLSVNPYRNIPNLYEPMPKLEDLNFDSDDADPHLYVLAARAHKSLFEWGINGKSQAILINGESGAGKTEAAKRIMAFLMELSKRKRDAMPKKKKKNNKNPMNPYAKKKKKASKHPKPPGGMFRGSVKRIQDTFQKIKGTGKKPGSQVKADESDAIEPIDRNQGALEKIILRTNPLLEAFGNARTIRNDNSSRFGKFVQLEYNTKDQVIMGAKTRHFLLEKSRVTSHGRGERNYHIFYQMCAAFENNPDDPVFEDLQMLKPYDHYSYLTASAQESADDGETRKSSIKKKKDSIERDGVDKMAERAAKYLETHRLEVRADDRRVFLEETSKALKKINLSVAEQKNIWKVLAAILHLGNLKFHSEKSVDKKGREITITAVDVDEVEVKGETTTTIDVCASLLGVPTDLLVNALTRKTFSAGKRNSVSEIPLSLNEASNSRDGLAKAMYEALFEWMLDKINLATGNVLDELQGGGKKKAKAPESPVFIGILDIFGFEMLEDNSFEQLCINYANEALQGMFDEHIFKLETEAYAAEKIDIELLGLEFRDNIPLLEILNKKATGVFQLMDEQGALGSRGSDQGLFQAIDKQHTVKPGPGRKLEDERFAGVNKGPDGRLFFSINHFVGVVEYTITGMVEKNADHLQADLADLIAAGGMPVEEKELTPEELKIQQENMRMNKTNEEETSKPVGASLGIEDPDAKPDGNSFSFLQSILRLREKRNLGEAEEEAAAAAAAAADKPDKPKKKMRGKKQKKMAKLQSVSSKFRKQMTSLKDLLETTEQHFVRCMKPNDRKEPPTVSWDHHMVNAQLRMLGALEMVRVRRMGYPIRTPFEDFLPKFPTLLKKFEIEYDKGYEDRQACVQFLQKGDPGGKNKRWYLGENKLFLREKTFKQLVDHERTLKEADEAREARLRFLQAEAERKEKERRVAATVQKMIRGNYHRRRYLRYRNGIVKLQAGVRSKLDRKKFQQTVKALIQIQKLARGFIVRKRMGALGKVATALNPIAKAFLARKRINKLLAQRRKFANVLKPGECVALEADCVADGPRKKGEIKHNTLILTTGPQPRILFVGPDKSKVRAALRWDEKVLCGLMANEHKLILYTKPSEGEAVKVEEDENARQRLYRFVFVKPVAALWLLALKEIFTIHDLLNLEIPDFDQIAEENPGIQREVIEDHGNMLPLNRKTNRGFLFGGATVLGGMETVTKSAVVKLNQKVRWRERFFILKECTLFWFQNAHGDVPMGQYPIGGISLSTVTTARPADGDDKGVFDAQFRMETSLEIESKLLRFTLKLNFNDDSDKQRWLAKMKTALRSRQKANQQKRMSISRGVLDLKGFNFSDTQQNEDHHSNAENDLESQHIDLKSENDDNAEDIEQGLGDELMSLF